MERVIKFRLPWFKFKDNSFSHFSYWGRIDYKGEPSKECFTAPGMSSPYYHKEDQQFTGLHDKNGKEIYDSDFIHGRIVRTDKTVIIKGYVQYIPELAKYVCRYKSPRDWDLKMDLSVFHEIEIIGNIFENPELLKQ